MSSRRALWRLFRESHGPGLDGIGGTFAAGRWHKRGARVVYFGLSPAIAVLERLAHTDPDLLPSDLQLASFEFAEPVEWETAPPSLSPGWTQDLATTQAIGAEWFTRQRTCVLIVPSAIVPESDNVILNSAHPHSALLRLTTHRSFTFDPRLL